jgi:hypothetical protein
MPTSSYNSPGTYTLSIPNNAYNITVQARGARGGRGGTDADAQGGQGGTTTTQGFRIDQNYVARTLTIFVGNNGGNGVDSQPNAAGGGGGSGMASGGSGGNAGDPPYSGGGGGGGGASGLRINGVNAICMAGSGGGGGASDNKNGGSAGNQSLNAASVGSVTPSNGGTGGDPGGTDGGGGGGGGGGDNGGGGGGPGQDNSNGGGGGAAGGSSYKSSLITAISYSPGQTASDGSVSVSWSEAAPQINTFNISPNPQNSSGGTPKYTTSISWTTSFASSSTLTSSAGESWSSSPVNITNLPQSNANGTSPSSRSYTVSASNDGGTVTQTKTVNARNDNTPSNSWTTSFTNLDPSNLVTLGLGTLSGVDMPTSISTSGSGNFIGNSGSFAGTKLFNNGDTIQLRTTTLPFNTDISGETGIYGKENIKTITVTTPSGSFNVTVGTRAPRINEDFDYANNINKYPYEDIDFVTNTPTEFLTSAQVNANDIEIDMEIKVDKPGAQVSINGGGWQNARSI